MDILITGVAGFVGYHTAKAALRRGDRVIGIDDLSGDKRGQNDCAQRIGKLIKLENFFYADCDIRNIGQIKGFFPGVTFERCVHLAAETGVQGCYEHAYDYVANNMRGFDIVAAWCADEGIQLIYASSASVYGNIGNQVMHENLRATPANLYGFTKYYNELSAAKFSDRSRLDSIGLRFFNVYGPLGRPDSLFMKLLTSTAENPVMIYGNGELQRDWTHVSDIVHGIFRAMDHLGTGPYIFNLGSGEPHPINEAITYLEEAGAQLHYRKVPDISAYEIERSEADYSKARLSFGWSPKVTLYEGLKDLVEWFNSIRQ